MKKQKSRIYGIVGLAIFGTAGFIALNTLCEDETSISKQTQTPAPLVASHEALPKQENQPSQPVKVSLKFRATMD